MCSGSSRKSLYCPLSTPTITNLLANSVPPSLNRLEQLTNQDEPFFMTIAPFAPHVGHAAHRPIPAARHENMFPNMGAPRTPNFNPEQSIQSQKGGWIGSIQRMNQTAVDFADFVYRSRVQSLQAVDEIIEDVIEKLREKGQLENTYVIYTTDNGYHVGQHRLPAGKSTYFAEDTNLPFFVRGPGVPAGRTSNVPGLHLDLAPTFLDIAGLDESEWPVFFDGRSLLPQWRSPGRGNGEGGGQGNGKESVGIEYWGRAGIEAPSAGALGSPFLSNSYKTVRVLGEDQGWLYTKWCTGEVELYNTTADRHELNNVVGQHGRIANRLNALTMVTKSCTQGGCRDPWGLIDTPDGETITTLTQALQEKYDGFFADFPKVEFGTCLQFQDDSNEAPYYPPLPESGGLGREYRNRTDVIQPGGGRATITINGRFGTQEQRTATNIGENSRVLTDAELAAR